MAVPKLESEIRKYKLDELLILNATLSRDLFLQKKAFKEIEIRKKIGAFSQSFYQYLTAWGLSDLSFIAIKNSNDYRAIFPQGHDILHLNNLLIGLSDDLADKEISDLKAQDIKTKILFGLSQKEFWYQDILRGGKLVNNFLRYYLLLDQIPAKYFVSQKQPKDDLILLTGFDIKGFSQLLLAIWTHILTVSVVINISIEREVKGAIPLWTEENILKCLSFLTADYRYYRDPSHRNNPLFFKPIIKTDSNKLIVGNVFIFARKFYEGIYWLIRDHYRNCQLFLNNFGNYYEKYIEEILKFYLGGGQFERVEKIKGRRADWLIHTKEYLLVVEQKSCLLTIALKEEYPSLPDLDSYLLKNFKEAYSQLENTVRYLGQTRKVIIKLVLHFENLYVGEATIKERINRLCEREIDDLSNFFLIDTEEFEELIQILADDEDIFNKVISKKIEYESEVPPGEGKEFKYIIDKFYKGKSIRFFDSQAHFFNGLWGESLR